MINKRLKDALFIDQWSELCMDTLGRFSYVLVSKCLRPLIRTLSNTQFVVFKYRDGNQYETETEIY